MIGKACVSLFQYYDSNNKKFQFKKRPFLIIGKADCNDYVALPISSIKNSQNINSRYDYPLNVSEFPKMNLKNVSYVRTHKQTIINTGSISKVITDFKNEYEEDYLEICIRFEEFQKQIIDNVI